MEQVIKEGGSHTMEISKEDIMEISRELEASSLGKKKLTPWANENLWTAKI